MRARLVKAVVDLPRRRSLRLGLLGVAILLASSGAATSAPSRAEVTFSPLVAGDAHTCVVAYSGAAKCWGSNAYGQLGDGTTTDRHTPVVVSSLASGVTALAAGKAHTCALTTQGGVKCWGRNAFGQLGDATTTDRHTPVDVSGLASGVAEIRAGGDHTCALTQGGAVKCWGFNGSGQLGDRTTKSRHVPVDVSGLGSGVLEIAAGARHTCAITSARAVKCWGDNSAGEVGDGTTTDRHRPVAASFGPLSANAVSAGVDDTCALTWSGSPGAKCWGANSSGQLGDGTTTERHTPVYVYSLSTGVSAIAVGGHHTCARTTGNLAKCWGANGSGQLGTGNTGEFHVPTTVYGPLVGVITIAAGLEHSCARLSGLVIKCWGSNASGQLGTGIPHNALTPTGVRGLVPRCVVPNVVGKPLAKAKARIVNAHCSVGTVTRVASSKKRGIVVHQRPAAGKRLKKGAKVNLEVSRGP